MPVNNAVNLGGARLVTKRGWDYSNVPSRAWVMPKWDDVLRQNTVTNPDSIPQGYAYSVSWSEEAEYLAVGHLETPYLAVYQRTDADLIRIAQPDSFPAAGSYSSGVDWSNCGTFLAVSHDSDPYMSVFQRVENVLTRIANPNSIPNGKTMAVSWSPNGEFLSFAGYETETIINYRRTGTTITRLANADSMPATVTSAFKSVDWSPCGEFLAACGAEPPYLHVYQRNNLAFEHIDNPDSAPQGIGEKVRWSPCGGYLAVAHQTYPYMSIYSFNGTSLARVANPDSIPTENYFLSVAWHPTGEYITFAKKFIGPEHQSYKRIGNTFLAIANPFDVSNVNATEMEWSNDGLYYASSSEHYVSPESTPYILIYKSSGTVPTQGTLRR